MSEQLSEAAIPKCSSKQVFLKFPEKETYVLVFFLIWLQTFRPATLLRRDSNTGPFQWILWNFEEHVSQLLLNCYERNNSKTTWKHLHVACILQTFSHVYKLFRFKLTNIYTWLVILTQFGNYDITLFWKKFKIIIQ